MNAYGVRANVCPGDSFSLNCHCMVLICLVSALNGRVHPISVRFECAQGRLTVFPGELLTTQADIIVRRNGVAIYKAGPEIRPWRGSRVPVRQCRARIAIA